MKWSELDPQERVQLCKLAGLEGRVGLKVWGNLSLEEKHTLKGYLSSLGAIETTSVNNSYLMWVGAKYYPTYRDFIFEARRLGISKRIGKAVNAMSPGKTVIYLAHDDGLVGQSFIFGYFILARVEIVLPAGLTRPTWLRVKTERITDVSREEARGSGWRTTGGIYLMSETDTAALTSMAASLGLRKAEVEGGIVSIKPRSCLGWARGNGIAVIDPAIIQEMPLCTPASDASAPRVGTGHHKWTRSEEQELVAAIDQAEGSISARLTRFCFDHGLSHTQAFYRYKQIKRCSPTSSEGVPLA